jgi:hypothetical protein
MSQTLNKFTVYSDKMPKINYAGILSVYNIKDYEYILSVRSSERFNMALFEFKPKIGELVAKAILKSQSAPKTDAKSLSKQADKHINQILAAAEKKTKAYNQIITKITSDNEKNIEQLKAQSTAEILRLKSEFDQTLKKEKETALLQNQKELEKLKAEYEEKENQLKLRITEAQTKAEKFIAEEKAKYLEQIAWLKQELKERTQAHNAELAEKLAQADENIARIKAVYAEETAKIKTDAYETVKNEKELAVKEFKETINNLKAEHKAKQLEYERRIGLIEAENEQTIAAIQNENEARCQEYEQTISKLKAQSQQAIVQLKSEYEEKLAAQIENTVKAQTAAAAESKNKIRLQEQINSLTLKISQRDKEIIQLKSDHSAEIAGIKAQMLTANEKARTSAKTQMQQEIISIKDEYAEKEANYIRQIAQIEKTAAQEKAKMLEEISSLKNQLDAVKQGYENQITVIKAETQQAIKSEKANAAAKQTEIIEKLNAENAAKIKQLEQQLSDAKALSQKAIAAEQEKAAQTAANLRTEINTVSKYYEDEIACLKAEQEKAAEIIRAECREIIAQAKIKMHEEAEILRKRAENAEALIDSLNTENHETIAKMRIEAYEETENLRKRAENAEAMLETLKKAKTQSEELLSGEKAKVQELTKKNAELNLFYQEKLAQLNAELTEEIAKTKQQANEDTNIKLAELKAEKQREIEALKEKWAQTEAKYLQQFIELKEATQKAIAFEKTAAQQAVAAIRAELETNSKTHTEQIAGLKQEYESTLAKTIADSKHALNKAIYEADRKLADQAELTTKAEALAASESQAKAKAEENLRIALLNNETLVKNTDALKSQYEKQLAEQKEEFTQIINAQRQQIESLKTQIQQAITNAKQQADEKLAAQKTESENIIRSLNEQIQSIKAQAAADIENERQKANEKLTQQKAEFEKTADFYRQQLDAAMTEAQKDIDDVREQMQAKLTEQIQLLGKAQAEEKLLANEKTKIEENLQIALKNNDALTEQLEELKAQSEQKFAEQRSEFEKIVKYYKQQLENEKTESQKLIEEIKRQNAEKLDEQIKLTGKAQAQLTLETKAKAKIEENLYLALRNNDDLANKLEELKAQSEQKFAEQQSEFEKIVKYYKEQLENAKTQTQQAVAEAKQQAQQQLDAQIQLTSKAEAIAAAEIKLKTELQQQLQNEKSKLDELTRKTAEIEAESIRAILQEQAKTQQTIAKLNAESELKYKAYEQQISELKTQHSLAVEQIRAEMDRKLSEQAQQTEKANALAMLESKTRIRTQEQLIIEKAKIEELTAKIAQAQMCAEEKLAAQKNEFNQIIENLKNEFAQKEKGFRLSLAAAEQDAQNTIEQERKKLQSAQIALKAEMDAKSQTYEQMFAKIKSDAEQSVAQIKAEAQQTIVNVKSEFSEKLAKVLAETQEAINTEKARSQGRENAYINAIETIQAETAKKSALYEDQIAKIKAELGMKMVRMKIEADRAVAAERKLTKQLERQVDNLRAILADSAMADLELKLQKIEPSQAPAPQTDEDFYNIKKLSAKVRGYLAETLEQQQDSTTSSKP